MLGKEALLSIFSQLPESQMINALKAGGISLAPELHYADEAGAEDQGDGNMWSKIRVDTPMGTKPPFETDYSKIFKEVSEEGTGQDDQLLQSLFMPQGVEEERGVGPRGILDMTQGQMA